MVVSYTLARIEPPKDSTVYKEVLKLKEVKEVITTYGEFDMIVKTEVDSLPALDEFIFNKLRVIPGILYTTTLIQANFNPEKEAA